MLCSFQQIYLFGKEVSSVLPDTYNLDLVFPKAYNSDLDAASFGNLLNRSIRTALKVGLEILFKSK